MNDRENEITEQFRTKKSRHVGLELLRIVAMGMIVALHLSVHTFHFSDAFGFAILLNSIIGMICCGCVNLFALLSGWGGGPRLSRVLLLWGQCLFYSIGICLLFYCMDLKVTHADWMGGLRPITSNFWWYVTAYFGLLPLMPLFSAGIRVLSIKQLKQVLLVILIIIVIIPSIYDEWNVYGLNKGYSTLWLAFCYIVGGILRRLHEENVIPYAKKWTYSTIIICIILFSSLLYYEGTSLPLHNWAKKCTIRLFHYYNSPGTCLISIMIFLFFVNLDIKKDFLRQIVVKLGALTFGTYLITVHPLVWRRFVNWHIDNLSLGRFLLLFAGLLTGMLAGSFIIEAARQFVFKVLSSNCAFSWITIIHNKRNTHFK